MLRVGLTGGIGSGKSTVARIFEVLGIPVYYADEASKRLYQTDPELMASIRRHFGEEMYKGGMLNREKLAAAVFGSPTIRFT
jgi:dephospho-CoA kinase